MVKKIKINRCTCQGCIYSTIVDSNLSSCSNPIYLENKKLDNYLTSSIFEELGCSEHIKGHSNYYIFVKAVELNNNVTIL